MKALIFSDSHGETRIMKDVIGKNKDLDIVIHAGDCIWDIEMLKYKGFTYVYVPGNHDLIKNKDKEVIFVLQGLNCMLVHGHRHRVKTEKNLKTLVARCKELGVNICIFGHTHRALYKEIEGITFVNPGSIALNDARNKGKYSYGIMEINDGNIKAEIVEMSA